MRADISAEAMERSLWGSFTHQQIFVNNFLVARQNEMEAKKAGAKKTRDKNTPVCVYVFRGGKLTLTLHPDDLQVSKTKVSYRPPENNAVNIAQTPPPVAISLTKYMVSLPGHSVPCAFSIPNIFTLVHLSAVSACKRSSQKQTVASSSRACRILFLLCIPGHLVCMHAARLS